MVAFYLKGSSRLTCAANVNGWLKSNYFRYEHFVRRHHWKVLLVGVSLIGLCCLGFKSMEFERDLMGLWLHNSSRLHNEMSYIQRISGDRIDRGSVETIIQVLKSDVITTDVLLEHLQLMEKVIRIKVSHDENRGEFSLENLCQRLQVPRLHEKSEDEQSQIRKFIPCQIITPLNCFWEGSKLMIPNAEHGYTNPFIPFDWRQLDLKEFLKLFNNSGMDSLFVTKLFEEAQVGRGFVDKPCIDVSDPLCPNRSRILNPKSIDAILNKGCYQLSANLYKYPRSIFVGNNNQAIQSLIILQSPSHVSMSLGLGWSERKAQQVINMWIDKLRKTVMQFNNERPVPSRKRIEKSSFFVFTNNSLQNALADVNQDETLVTRYLISIGIVTLFVAIVFLSSDNLVVSHCWLAITGTMLELAAMVAGLGLTAAIGIKFSVLTTQVIPFVMLGLGLDDILLLTSRYSLYVRKLSVESNTVSFPVAQTVSDCSTVILLSFSLKLAVIGAAIIVPVPLMYSFSIQVLSITVLQTATAVFLYPCLLHLDTIRRNSNRVDILCCLLRHEPTSDMPTSSQTNTQTYESVRFNPSLNKSQVIFSTEFTTSANDLIPTNVRQYCEINPVNISPTLPNISKRKLTKEGLSDGFSSVGSRQSPCCLQFQYRISRTVLHIIALVPVQITVILVMLIIIVFGIYSAFSMDYGLLIESIFLKNSNEYNYVKHESEEFRINTFYIVTQQIDYISHQRLLIQLHEEVVNVNNVEMFGSGKFWLSSFLTWLQRLQSDFDRDVKNHFILLNGTWTHNASRNGLLALTIMVQDGDKINLGKLRASRLIRDGEANSRDFYLYLNVWRSISVDYDTLPCILYPEITPLKMDVFVPLTTTQKPKPILMSPGSLRSGNPLQFVSCKYFHRGVRDKSDLSLVEAVRNITNRYSQASITSFPLGNAFALSEQYVAFKLKLVLIGVSTVVVVFIVGFLVLNSAMSCVFITLLLTTSFFSPLVVMYWCRIPLNATSGVMALWSGSLGLRFSLYFIIFYVDRTESPGLEADHMTILGGNKQTGCCISMKMFISSVKEDKFLEAFTENPCSEAAVSAMLGMAFLSMSNINFIRDNFLFLPLIGIIHSLLNFYLVTPCLFIHLLPKTKLSLPIHRKIRSDSSLSSSHSKNHQNRRQSRATCQSVNRPPHKGHGSTKPYKTEKEQQRHLEEGKLSTIPEESSSMQSSINSHICGNCSKSNESHSSQSSIQNVESSLIVHYSNPDSTNHPAGISVKTSFKYRKPESQAE